MTSRELVSAIGPLFSGVDSVSQIEGLAGAAALLPVAPSPRPPVRPRVSPRQGAQA